MLTKSNSQGNHTPGGIGNPITGSGRSRGRARPSFRLPGRFFRDLVGKLCKAICVNCRASSRVSSSAGGSRQFVTPIDVHRKEAIEDCIEFINHSSSLPRSASVSAQTQSLVPDTLVYHSMNQASASKRVPAER